MRSLAAISAFFHLLLYEASDIMTETRNLHSKICYFFHSLPLWQTMLCFVLLLLTALSSIKLVFLGLGIDEEYSVAMSYRMLIGDRMLLEMWEPHQTSGFVNAFLIRLFLVITGSTEYLVIYLRLCGIAIQAFISLLLFNTLRRIYNLKGAFICALFFFNTLPKWIPSPEFANMLVWWSVLAYICFLRYYLSEKARDIYLIAAGLALSALVLVYPSCILAVPVVCISMIRLRRRSLPRELLLVWGTCLATGSIYLGYFLIRMTPEEFFFGLRQMMSDGSHSADLPSRLHAYMMECISLLPHAAIVLILAGLTCLILRNFRNLKDFLSLLLLFSLLEQLAVWVMPFLSMQTPLLYFYFLYLCGVLAFFFGRKASCEDIPASIQIQAWFGLAFGGAVWLSSLLITNTTISATGSYLICGLIGSLLLVQSDLQSSRHHSRYLYQAAFVCLLGATLFARGWLVYENNGIKANALFVKQKALYGPARGIYCRYTDGYQYNLCAELMNEYVNPGECVLYIGVHPLRYMLGNVRISNYSTISTPTFDHRLLSYWELFPDKYPDVVIVDSGKDFPEAFKLLSLDRYSPVEQEGILLYRLTEAPDLP